MTANNSLTQLPVKQLKRAVDIRERIDTLTFELSRLLNAPVTSNGHKTVAKAKGISAAGRAKIAAAQRLRWAKHKAKKGTVVRKKAASGKQRLSAAGRAKVAAAVKARWERFRAAKAKAAKND